MRIQRNKDKISHEDIQPSNNTMTHFNDMYQFSMKFSQNNKMIILVFEHVEWFSSILLDVGFVKLLGHRYNMKYV